MILHLLISFQLLSVNIFQFRLWTSLSCVRVCVCVQTVEVCHSQVCQVSFQSRWQMLTNRSTKIIKPGWIPLGPRMRAEARFFPDAGHQRETEALPYEQLVLIVAQWRAFVWVLPKDFRDFQLSVRWWSRLVWLNCDSLLTHPPCWLWHVQGNAS